MKQEAGTLRWLLALACLALSGCAEMVRWPDRMAQKPAARAEAPAPEGHHVVRPGDTVYSIAFRNQLDFRELAAWNDIGPDFLIRPGQLIRLSPPPASESTAASSSIQTSPLYYEEAPPPPIYEPPPPVAPRSWQWPVLGPVLKPFNGSSKGLDIGGELGQPVLAAASGKVVYSGGALKGYGELIIIKHDDLRLSAYGYNRRRLVAEGANVVAGQPIAELGLGPEQKPVLHFEIREKGKPVDPMNYLPAR